MFILLENVKFLGLVLEEYGYCKVYNFVKMKNVKEIFGNFRLIELLIEVNLLVYFFVWDNKMILSYYIVRK